MYQYRRRRMRCHETSPLTYQQDCQAGARTAKAPAPRAPGLANEASWRAAAILGTLAAGGRSFLSPVAKRLITAASEAPASSSHPSGFSPSKSRTILANSCVRRRAWARAPSEAQSLPRYSFYSPFSIYSRRMNRSATFLALGDAPAMEPLFAFGTREGFSPRPSTYLRLESRLFTVSTPWR